MCQFSCKSVEDHMCFSFSLPPCVSQTKFLAGSFLAPSVKRQEKKIVNEILKGEYFFLNIFANLIEKLNKNIR